ncbi:ABC-F family ATP-binding cassette domain-containing protein [Thermopetrobacter sp. TC1]|uniref:ABC-F family ATP-binding cassette domain-containing protein n=1 Tax=Thermopetrobacter sp. TC1 TaxID=1495045 RepID=UPI00056E4D84|nr:ABC-F family ATP-binding cassette domain-containing protein [Thermopetrobacter sp. TC1]
MLHINDLTYRIGEKVLFEKATLALPAGARAGLIGRNGAGKSTLFRLIFGELSPESGRIQVRKGIRIGTVAQEAPGGEESLLNIVLAADKERAALLRELETVTDPHRIGEIHTRLADIDAHAAPARAARILAGLGFSEEEMHRPCSSFSGGWRMRVALAAALFAAPDLLLLDEPTNYLDLEGVLWLKQFLRSYPHTFLLISHDRDLLTDSVNVIVHLTERRLDFYSGNFETFQKLRAARQAQMMKLRKKQEEKRRHMEAFIARFRAKASKARQAQSRLKALARMKEVELVVEERVPPFYFPSPTRRLNPPLIRLEEAAAGYDGRAVLRDLNLRIDPDDRIALLGLNGQGKSTLAKVLCGRLPLLSGVMRHHKRLRTGYFAQHQLEELNPQQSPYQHVLDLMPEATEAERRAKLGQFGFSADLADNPVQTLSGGEKARLLFMLAGFHAPHLLVLDEPTNHLDMEARARLIEALNDYEGAVILIAHDRQLIEAVADRLWLVDGGVVRPFEGDLADYERLVLERARMMRKRARAEKSACEGRRGQAAGETEAAKKQQAAPGERRPNVGRLRRELARLEEDMAALEEKIGVFDAALDGGRLYAEDAEQAARFAAARTRLAEELTRLEERWLALSATLEELEAARSQS